MTDFPARIVFFLANNPLLIGFVALAIFIAGMLLAAYFVLRNAQRPRARYTWHSYACMGLAILGIVVLFGNFLDNRKAYAPREALLNEQMEAQANARFLHGMTANPTQIRQAGAPAFGTNSAVDGGTKVIQMQPAAQQ